jgi:acetyl esterase/lipase
MPAGACLISPWVDLTHSFPSIAMETEFDYVPAFGFHAAPSLSWPPPTFDEMRTLGQKINPALEEPLHIDLDGVDYSLQHQIQMYAANWQLQIPLVSGVCAASLGGQCFLLKGGREGLQIIFPR